MIVTDWGRFDSEMTAFDALMWKFDEEPSLRSSGAGMFMLDRSPDWDHLLETVDRTTRLFVRLRQRVVVPPLQVAHPRWVVDPDFDLSFHVRRVSLPSPATRLQLLDLAALEATAVFDKSRSPWVFTVVEGLDDGRAAVIFRAHHALTDGSGAVAVFARMFDTQRDGVERGPLPPAPAPERVTQLDLLRQTLSPIATFSSVRGVARVVRHPTKALSRVAGVAQLAASLRQPHEPSRVLQGRSTTCRVGTLDVGFDDLRRASKAADGSLNDAFLAAIAGGLRRYHEKVGDPVEIVRLGFPVSIRTDDDSLGENRFAGAVLPLPVGVEDARARIEQIHALARAARHDNGHDAMAGLAPLIYRVPTWLMVAVGPMGGIELQASNVPGVRHRHYLGGAEVTGTYAFGPHPGTAAMITLFSHVDTCCVAVNADAAAITDFDVFMDCLQAGFDEVLDLLDGAT